MLEFNDHGFLIPNTVIPSSVEELKQYFVAAIPTETRMKSFENYIRYSNELKTLLNEKSIKQWVNGSFVTQLQNPNDIDIVTFIDHRHIETLKGSLDDFGVKGAWQAFTVDAYIVEIFPEKHLNHFFYKSDMAYWMDKFGKNRRDQKGIKSRKGFLEIIY